MGGSDRGLLSSPDRPSFQQGYGNSNFNFNNGPPNGPGQYGGMGGMQYGGTMYFGDHNPSAPFQPVPMDKATLAAMTKSQVEFYFSTNNLVKDTYLRSQMDAQGYLPLSFIAGFKRLQTLTKDIEVIKESIADSTSVEINDTAAGIMIRRRGDWDNFLPVAVPNFSTFVPGAPAFVPATFVPGAAAFVPGQGSVAAGTDDEQDQDELDFKFDEDLTSQSAASSAAAQSASQGRAAQIAAFETDTDGDSEFEDSEVEKILLLVQTPERPGKKGERAAPLRTGFSRPPKMATKNGELPAASFDADDWASQINSELGNYERKKLEKASLGSSLGSSVGSSWDGRGVKTTTGFGGRKDAPTARAAPTITTSPLATSGFSVGKSDASAVPAPVLCPGSEEKPLSSSIPISIGGSRSRHAASNDSSGVDEATQRFYGLPAKNAESEPKAHKSKYGPNAVNETAVGWVMGRTRCPPKHGYDELSTSPRSVGSVGSLGSQAGTPQHPSYDLLANGFQEYKYHKYQARCFHDRKHKGPGQSSEMNTLLRFWSHFLQNTFNRRMYHDFFKIALEDSVQGARYGLECLFRLYSYGLEKKFRPDVFTDFVAMTLFDFQSGHLYGMEKFWGYLKYRKDKTPVEIDPIISTFLSKIKHVDDFAKPEFAPTAPAEQLPFPVAVVTKPRNSRRSTNPAAAGNQDMTRGRANSGAGRPRSDSGAGRPRSDSGAGRPRSDSGAGRPRSDSGMSGRPRADSRGMRGLPGTRSRGNSESKAD